MVVLSEAEHLAQVVIDRLALGQFLRSLRLHPLERGVDEFTDLDHPRAVAVAHEDVFVAVDAHQDDLVVARTGQVELLLDPRADRGDHRTDLLVRQHLVDARALDVQDLALEREDRLVLAVAALFCTVVNEHAAGEGEVVSAGHLHVVYVDRLGQGLDAHDPVVVMIHGLDRLRWIGVEVPGAEGLEAQD
jgi:hypothetical protein